VQCDGHGLHTGEAAWEVVCQVKLHRLHEPHVCMRMLCQVQQGPTQTQLSTPHLHPPANLTAPTTLPPQETRPWLLEPCQLLGEYVTLLYTDWLGQALFNVSSGVLRPFVCAGYTQR
jgi:hypothetical protein